MICRDLEIIISKDHLTCQIQILKVKFVAQISTGEQPDNFSLACKWRSAYHCWQWGLTKSWQNQANLTLSDNITGLPASGRRYGRPGVAHQLWLLSLQQRPHTKSRGTLQRGSGSRSKLSCCKRQVKPPGSVCIWAEALSYTKSVLPLRSKISSAMYNPGWKT